MILYKNETFSGYSYTPSDGYSGLYFDTTGQLYRVDASGNTFAIYDGSDLTDTFKTKKITLGYNDIINTGVSYQLLPPIADKWYNIIDIKFRFSGTTFTSFGVTPLYQIYNETNVMYQYDNGYSYLPHTKLPLEAEQSQTFIESPKFFNDGDNMLINNGVYFYIDDILTGGDINSTITFYITYKTESI